MAAKSASAMVASTRSATNSATGAGAAAGAAASAGGALLGPPNSELASAPRSALPTAAPDRDPRSRRAGERAGDAGIGLRCARGAGRRDQRRAENRCEIDLVAAVLELDQLGHQRAGGLVDIENVAAARPVALLEL